MPAMQEAVRHISARRTGRAPDPPQPQPRNFSAGDGKVATHTPAPAEAGIEANDATGGEYWNHVLGDNTSAGTLRFLAAVGLFVLIAAALFWLVG
ncbi:hypothetical protein Q1M64_12240 (plasmid) [Sinorhizobium meliloti]|nr:hypothetical protein Q1M64_12240 [Sinorhizobium meliloti]